MAKWASRLPLFLGFLLFSMLLNTIGSVILQIIETLGVTKQEAAWLEAFKDPPAAIASLFAATVIAAIGIKRTLLIGIALATACCLLLPTFPSYTTVRIFFAFVGIGFALVRIGSMAAIGRFATDSADHLRFLALMDACFTIAAVIAIWIFSGFAGDGTLGWTNFYWLMAGLGALAFLGMSTLKLPAARVAEEQPASLRVQGAMALSLLQKPLVLNFLACAFVFVLIEQAVATWLPTYNNNVAGLATPLAIQAASLFVLATAAGRFSVSLLASRYSWHRLAFACVIGGVGIMVLIMLQGPTTHGREITSWSEAPIQAFLYPLIGLIVGPIYPIINSVVLSSHDHNEQPVLAGLIAIFSALGGVVGSLAIGNMFALVGGATAFRLLLVPTALLGYLLYRMRQAQARG